MEASGQPSYTFEQRLALEDLGMRCKWSVFDLPDGVLDEFIDQYKISKARSGSKQPGLKACCRFSIIVSDQGGCAILADV